MEDLSQRLEKDSALVRKALRRQLGNGVHLIDLIKITAFIKLCGISRPAIDAFLAGKSVSYKTVYQIRLGVERIVGPLVEEQNQFE